MQMSTPLVPSIYHHFIRGLGDSLAVEMKDSTSIENSREILETFYSLKDETKSNTKVRMVRQGKNSVTQEQFKSFKNKTDERFGEYCWPLKRMK